MNLYQLGKLKKNLEEIKVGDTIRVFEKLDTEGKKLHAFEGILISKKHGKGINATFTLRAVFDGVGVEKTYPLHSPIIEKMEVLREGKVRRAKLYYLRKTKGKRAKIKRKIIERETKEKIKEETETEVKPEAKTEAKTEVKTEAKEETKEKTD